MFNKKELICDCCKEKFPAKETKDICPTCFENKYLIESAQQPTPPQPAIQLPQRPVPVQPEKSQLQKTWELMSEEDRQIIQDFIEAQQLKTALKPAEVYQELNPTENIQ